MIPTLQQEREQVDVIAAAVLAGEDRIDVPNAMVEEVPPDAPPELSERRDAVSYFAQIKSMTVQQKVKLAMKGNREARNILLRDANKMIRRMVLLNPRITEDEVVIICKDRNADTEVLRQIGDNRDWVNHYGVRVALTENARTPLAVALRLLKSLVERDLRTLAKSKNVPNAVSTQARRMLLAKQMHRG